MTHDARRLRGLPTIALLVVALCCATALQAQDGPWPTDGWAAVVNSWNVFGGRYASALGAMLDALEASVQP